MNVCYPPCINCVCPVFQGAFWRLRHIFSRFITDQTSWSERS